MYLTLKQSINWLFERMWDFDLAILYNSLGKDVRVGRNETGHMLINQYDLAQLLFKERLKRRAARSSQRPLRSRYGAPSVINF